MKRKVDGVLLLDKPAGITSNLALQKVRRLYRAEKGGHTGTLDPFATGLLPICLGEATKFSQYLLDADKVYLAEVRLGIRTATADPEGDILETRPVHVDESQVREVVPRFTGELSQLPPMYSALKHAGKPLYKYAREGVEIPREPRRVMVHAIDMLGIHDGVLRLRVHSGKGLYVRTLAEEIGAALGCGAHLQALRREAVGGLNIADAVGLDRLAAMEEAERDARLRPADSLLNKLPVLPLDIDAAWQLCHGQPIWRAGLKVGETLRAYAPDGRFLGVVQVDDEGRAAPRRLVAERP
ncbi:MAG TPA: tRNA pseudouridine(55) synthase TruB [Thiobacillaceae bacterium]|nr:tRNA pseudouridine(55) synthase TruB [Thiobacillaceae bacterium]